MRPPRNGPTLRQTSAESNSGLMGVAATETAATVRATSAPARFVFMAVLGWDERLAYLIRMLSLRSHVGRIILLVGVLCAPTVAQQVKPDSAAAARVFVESFYRWYVPIAVADHK